MGRRAPRPAPAPPAEAERVPVSAVGVGTPRCRENTPAAFHYLFFLKKRRLLGTIPENQNLPVMLPLQEIGQTVEDPMQKEHAGREKLLPVKANINIYLNYLNSSRYTLQLAIQSAYQHCLMVRSEWNIIVTEIWVSHQTKNQHYFCTKKVHGKQFWVLSSSFPLRKLILRS